MNNNRWRERARENNRALENNDRAIIQCTFICVSSIHPSHVNAASILC
jgi:hypothetical protein